MPLNIKNPSVERLADEVARLTGESKTEAIRKALEERRVRLGFRITGQRREERLRRLLEQEIWPIVPKDQLGRRLSRAEEEEILGYGSEGV
jgi:antitoxin VapB